MDYTGITEELKNIIQPVLDEENIELVELNYFRTRNSSLVRLLVDRRDGGIKLGDCARLNQKIGDILDSIDVLKERYVLEVSSPGLDRPLKTKNDFLRCIKRNVKFFLIEVINGKIEIEGIVNNVEDDKVILDIKDGVLVIPFINIAKAKQVICD